MMKIKKEYVSHLSAAQMWKIPLLDQVLDMGYMSGHQSTQLIDITVPHQNMKHKKKGRVTHVCEKPLPSGAVVRLDETWVSSPELIFLELANSLEIRRLILLGIQMCSKSTSKGEKSVSTKRKLEIFLNKTKGYRGHTKAVRALKYVEDGSASIMESLTFMLLTLPHSYGGYGLGGAHFNHEILLNAEAKRQLGKSRCIVDLYYAKAKLGIEYNSLAHHSTAFEQGEDTKRVSTLERQGINIISVTPIQIYRQNSCEEIAYNIASRLGKRIRIRTKDFETARMELRQLLPSKSIFLDNERLKHH